MGSGDGCYVYVCVCVCGLVFGHLMIGALVTGKFSGARRSSAASQSVLIRLALCQYASYSDRSGWDEFRVNTDSPNS